MTKPDDTNTNADATIEVRFKNQEGEWNTKIAKGKNLLDASRQCNAPVQTLCNGIGACVQCKVKVVKYPEHLSKPEALEKDLIGNIFHITGERLACQARILGEVVVEPLPAQLPKRKRFRVPSRSR